MWAHKEVAHPLIVDLLLKVWDAETHLQALGPESPNSFLRLSKQGPCLTRGRVGMEMTSDLCNLTYAAAGVASPGPV